MKNYQIYQTSRGERLYCTSHGAAQRFLAGHLTGAETAVWSRSEFARPQDLCRVARGMYREYPDLEEGFWPVSEAEEALL